MDMLVPSKNDDDDVFVNMMYEYCTNVLLQPDSAPLLTRRAMLNGDREEGVDV